MHAASGVALRHFLMDDAAARSHPLNVAGGNGATVAHAVTVLNRARENVGDRLDAAMRMPGETGQIILRNVIAEVVEQQERVEVGSVAEAKGAAQVPRARHPSRVGFDWMRRFTGRMDMSISEGEVSPVIISVSVSGWASLGRRIVFAFGLDDPGSNRPGKMRGELTLL